MAKKQKRTFADVSFATSPEARALVGRIVERAIALLKSYDMEAPSPIDLTMDLVATHANGCPMDWQKLLDAPDGDFGHDVAGIMRHIDRQTGELQDCFVPRCALPERQQGVARV